MRNLSFSLKILACVALLLAIGLGVSLYSLNSFYSVRKSAEDINEIYLPLALTANELLDIVHKLRLSSGFYTKDGLNKYHEETKEYSLRLKNIVDDAQVKYFGKYEGIQDLAAGGREFLNILNAFNTSADRMYALSHEIDTYMVEYMAYKNEYSDLTVLLLKYLAARSSPDTPLMVQVSSLAEKYNKYYALLQEGYTTDNDTITAWVRAHQNEMGADIVPIANAVTAREAQAYINRMVALVGNTGEIIGKMDEMQRLITAESAAQEKLSNELLDSAYVLYSESSKRVTGASGSTYGISDSNIKSIWVLIAFQIIFSLLAILYLRKAVALKLRDFVEQVAGFTSGDSDLTKRIPVTSTDEIGQLAENINAFVQSTQNIIRDVKATSDAVVAGNTQLAATMEEMSSTFSHQAGEINAVVSNVDSINEASGQVVEVLTDNANEMRSTTEIVQNSKEQFSEVISSINDIKLNTEQLSDTVKNLSDSTSHIGDLLLVINDIADQTNLLALNAAIEAARAGEAGRGFAVVADEVRKLAERVQHSTSQISGIVTALQNDSASASRDMQSAVDSVNSGIDNISKTVELFETVVGSVNKMGETSESVNTNVLGQSGMIQAVHENSRSLASGIEESVTSVNELTGTVAHLQALAEKLKKQVEIFKV